MFDDFDPEAYADEAEQRWGDTDSYKESMRRTRSYTEDDWATLKAEADGIMRAFVALMSSGASARGDEAVELAESYRAHISAWFYPCSKEMHAMLADGYVGDPRFAASFDKYAVGLAAFVAEAIKENAAA